MTRLNDGKDVYHTPKPNDDPVLFEDSGLKPGPTYHYTVKTLDKHGKQPETKTASVLVSLPTDVNFVYAEDFSKYEPVGAESPRFGGAWRPVDGVLLQEQDVDENRIRKQLFVSDKLSVKKENVNDLSVRMTARIRVNKYVPDLPKPTTPTTPPGSTTTTTPGTTTTTTTTPTTTPPPTTAPTPTETPVLVGLGLKTDAQSGNGYAFVFYDKWRVAFINDPFGAKLPLLGSDDKAVAMTNPIKGEIFAYDWEPDKDYWVTLAWSKDPMDRTKAIHEAKIWPACGDRSSSREYEQKTDGLIKTIKIKDPKGVDTDKTDSTERTAGYPALVGGYKKEVTSAFDDVLIEIVPAGAPPHTQTPAAPPTPACPPGTSPRRLARDTSRDAFSRGPRFWTLTDGPRIRSTTMSGRSKSRSRRSVPSPRRRPWPPSPRMG